MILNTLILISQTAPNSGQEKNFNGVLCDYLYPFQTKDYPNESIDY